MRNLEISVKWKQHTPNGIILSNRNFPTRYHLTRSVSVRTRRMGTSVKDRPYLHSPTSKRTPFNRRNAINKFSCLPFCVTHIIASQKSIQQQSYGIVPPPAVNQRSLLLFWISSSSAAIIREIVATIIHNKRDQNSELPPKRSNSTKTDRHQ